MEENEGRTLERLTYFLLGSAVATGIAFLISPKSGRENREILANKAKEGKEFLEDKIRRGREYVKQGKEKAMEQGQDLAERAKDLVRGQAENVRSSVGKGEEPKAANPL